MTSANRFQYLFHIAKSAQGLTEHFVRTNIVRISVGKFVEFFHFLICLFCIVLHTNTYIYTHNLHKIYVDIRYEWWGCCGWTTIWSESNQSANKVYKIEILALKTLGAAFTEYIYTVFFCLNKTTYRKLNSFKERKNVRKMVTSSNVKLRLHKTLRRALFKLSCHLHYSINISLFLSLSTIRRRVWLFQAEISIHLQIVDFTNTFIHKYKCLYVHIVSVCYTWGC